ncbi:gag-pol polyprotein [Trifolium medium]|uniref:Gag-pol polyprotein n=1 Tax=Trifolium medium TaxID=97028 RepID=A0A392QNH6_9FABA|nr:gag-pol polyprotein [Trifolium medium]
MTAFLKSLDSRSWKAVLKGWDHPKIKDAYGVDTEELKREDEWSQVEDTTAIGNSKALNVHEFCSAYPMIWTSAFE